MKESEIRAWMRKRKVIDLWWYSIGEQVSEKPQSLNRIRELDVPPGQELLILHVTQAKRRQPVWFAFNLPEQRPAPQPLPVSDKSWQQHQRHAVPEAPVGKRVVVRRVARRITPLRVFIGVMLLVSVGLFSLIIYERMERGDETDPLLQAASESAGPIRFIERDTLPTLSLSVAKTDYMLFVENRGQKALPDLTIELFGDGKTYTYQHDETLRPGRILEIPVRDFVDAQQERVQPSAFSAERIVLSAEGYEDYDFLLKK